MFEEERRREKGGRERMRNTERKDTKEKAMEGKEM